MIYQEVEAIKKIEEVYQTLLSLEKRNKDGVTAREISKVLNTDRANISRYLNKLAREDRLDKINSRPVLYSSNNSFKQNEKGRAINSVSSFKDIVGANSSLSKAIEQAKAAILYPPKGLHTLLLGETGVGKSLFAELMHRFAIESAMLKKDAPFIQFNCADYADNPQLVMSQIFGVKKGSYTGANRDRDGLLKKADGGIIFLDEVHRLLPQGQEMLFTYIDKGYFRRLGGTDKKITVNVQIIAATTEDPQSFMLSTFMRRIPMTIKLPSLKERGIQERYCLLDSFLREESKRVGKRIYINRNSLISFLLYDCPHNIGQLNSDIQLACARAFLTYKTENKEYLMISQNELPQHVRKGLMKIHDQRNEVDRLLKDKGEVLYYSAEDGEYELKESKDENKLFYDLIEEKYNSLNKVELDDTKINEILNIDIESYFQKHLDNLPQTFKKEQIRKVVNTEIADLVDQILELATERLQRSFDEKIYLGLALHLQMAVERIINGDKIHHPELNNIRVNCPKEFMFAMEAAQFVDQTFAIETPLDEIGYLSMFLVKDPYKNKKSKMKKVAVLVIMHGRATASSMVEVANKLIGVEHAVGLDMPLEIEPEQMLERTLIEVEKIDKDRDLMLLVDMGSLTNFGEMISEKMDRKVKTIDMVSTPLVIDVSRKAVLGQNINEIYHSCSNFNKARERLPKNTTQKNAIITSCFTGEGASEKLKEVIKNEIKLPGNYEIITLNIINKDHFMTALKQYQDYYNICAVVSTIEIELAEIPFISAVDIFSGNGLTKLRQLVKESDLYAKIKGSLNEHIKGLDSEELVENIRSLINNIEKALKTSIPSEVKVGIVLHMSFLIEKLVKGEETTKFPDLQEFKREFPQQMEQMKASVKELENNYEITIQDNELAYLAKMFLNNAMEE